MTSTSSTSAERWKSSTSSETNCRGLRQQRAGDAGIGRGQRVDRDQPAIDRDADRRGAQRIVADRLQRQAERRMDDAPRQQEQHEQRRRGCRHRRCGRTRSKSNRPSSGPTTTPCRPSAPPVSRGQPLASLEQDQRDAERHHQPRQVGAAQHQQAGERSPAAPQPATATREAEQRIGVDVLGEQAGGIGAEAEERRVAERDDAGIAQDQVEREREQREDGDLVQRAGACAGARRSAANGARPRRRSPASASGARRREARRPRVDRGAPSAVVTALREQALRPHHQHDDHHARR